MAFGIGKLSKLVPVYRRCPAGKIHRVSADNPECGHTGQILDWCEEYQRWIPNPTKTDVAYDMLNNDEEFEVEREARRRIDEALQKGDLKPALDYRRVLMNNENI